MLSTRVEAWSWKVGARDTRTVSYPVRCVREFFSKLPKTTRTWAAAEHAQSCQDLLPLWATEPNLGNHRRALKTISCVGSLERPERPWGGFTHTHTDGSMEAFWFRTDVDLTACTNNEKPHKCSVWMKIEMKSILVHRNHFNRLVKLRLKYNLAISLKRFLNILSH